MGTCFYALFLWHWPWPKEHVHDSLLHLGEPFLDLEQSSHVTTWAILDICVSACQHPSPFVKNYQSPISPLPPPPQVSTEEPPQLGLPSWPCKFPKALTALTPPCPSTSRQHVLTVLCSFLPPNLCSPWTPAWKAFILSLPESRQGFEKEHCPLLLASRAVLGILHRTLVSPPFHLQIFPTAHFL